jgi:DNA topoisomerase-2
MASSQKYVKLKDQREHIELKSDMYIGSTKADDALINLVDETGKHIERKTISLIPGLFKICDEIIANAIDQYIRLKESTATDTKQVTCIKVDVSEKTGIISVYNDGDGIEVEEHTEHGVWIPELIFSHLLTSSNYDDTQIRTVQGTNGIGCKACNIMSKWFKVETLDHRAKKTYTQIFRDNMRIREKPVIKPTIKKTPSTRVTFLPDYTKFGLDGLSLDMFQVIRKRAYDVCAVVSPKIKVYFNDEIVPFSSFPRYVDLYIGQKDECKRVAEVVNDRWEVVVSPHDDGFEQVAFVNGLLTTNGGTHVKHVLDPIVKHIVTHIKSKHKVDVKPQSVKENIIIFIKCTVDNPTFNSQSKETLTTPVALFGSSAKLSDAFLKKICSADAGIVTKILNMYTVQTDKTAKKTDGKKQNVIRGLPKLEDAIWAGTPKSDQCTLILTEGDSAASMAIAGLSQVGRERYGVFPLKGKVMNVKDANMKKIADNEEITNIKKILGLENGKKYSDLTSLRYGNVMLMTDSDVDGSHIKGLVLNLFHAMWPSLLKDHSFIKSMYTPIIKAKLKDKVIDFYNITSYENWRENSVGDWKIKYYKGLGTSTNAEAKEYFKNMKTATYDFQDDKAMDLAFNKKKADDRKTWLSKYNKQDILDTEDKIIKVADFVNKELIHFSNDDLERSIPNMVDGLKRSQRKILFACFKRNLVKDEIRVAQLAGYVSEHSAYHHGEASLQSAIVGLAQDFVGSNNINLLVPNGQFGSRVHGGKDAGQPRYIHTMLSPITNAIFLKSDTSVLAHTEDDGVRVEPEFYAPVIPMILVNGGLGIGTGFSTNIPSYNPDEIIELLLQKINGESITKSTLVPWFRGFKGSIVSKDNKFTSRGVFKRTSPLVVTITELPIGTWTIDYKTDLEALLEKIPAFKKYENKSAENILITLHFNNEAYLDDTMDPDASDAFGVSKFESVFKLVSTKGLSVSNMYAFNEQGQITKYASPIKIIEAFYEVRRKIYESRKQALINTHLENLETLENKKRFIKEVVSQKIMVYKMNKAELENHLASNSYKLKSDSYDYLTRIPIYNFTLDKVKEIIAEFDALSRVYEETKSQTIESMWIREIEDIRRLNHA